MTTVSGDTTTTVGTGEPTSNFATSFQDSLADVFNAIRGSKLTAADLKFEQPNERQIYFAIVLSKLKQETPQLAAELLREAPTIRKALLQKGDRNALTHAIDKIISQAIKRGVYSKAQYADLKRFALSRAQVDANRGDLSGTRAASVNRYDDRATQTNIDAITQKVTSAEQRDATRKELRLFNNELKSAPGYKYQPGQTVTTSAPKSEPPAPTNPQGPSETDKPHAAPNPMTQFSAPNEFVYKPRSERDGKILVQVPLEYASEVQEIEIVSRTTGEVLKKLNYSGRGDDGRSYFRGDEPGDTLESAVYIRMVFRDGSDLGYSLNDSKSYFKY